MALQRARTAKGGKRERDKSARVASPAPPPPTSTQSTLQQLAAIVRAADDAILSLSVDGHILTWNAAAERLFGYTAEEAIGQPNTLIYPDNEKGRFARNLAFAKSARSARHYEAIRRAKDGRLIDVAVTSFPVFEGAGALIAVGVIYRDITPQKQLALEAARKSRLTALLESLARAANEAKTPEEVLQRCLEGICEYGQWPLACVGRFDTRSAPGTPRAVQWHSASLERFREFMRRTELTDHSTTSGYFVGRVLREKCPVWIASLKRPGAPGRMGLAEQIGIRSAFAFPVLLQDEVGAILQFFAEEPREPDQLFMDSIGVVSAQIARVIERDRGLEALKASQQKLEGILGSLREVVYSCDYHTYTPTYLSPAAESVSGYRSSDFRRDPLLWFKMIHPEDQARVEGALARLKAQGTNSAEYRIIRPDGSIRTVENHAQVVYGDAGRPVRIDGIVVDITERKAAEERADRLARYDALTDLPNRSLFQDRLAVAISQAKRRGELLAVLILNVDRFKQFNQTLGFGGGDTLIGEIAARLRSSLREADTIARFGWDEFAIIVGGLRSVDHIRPVTQKIGQLFAAPVSVQGHDLYLTASIGVAFYPGATEAPDVLVQHADAAMRHAKKDGGNGYQVYDPGTMAVRTHRLELESRLRQALAHNELQVHFQPKVNLLTGRVTGAEALVRWSAPDMGPISPAQFIPIAEDTGLIVQIGTWVLHTACAQATVWRRHGHDLRIAVNLSPRQFRDRDLYSTIVSALNATGLAGENLELEITEGTAMANVEHTVIVLDALHRLGVRLAVDDFGTGYSSLSYLKRFPLDCLKIDRSFVSDIGRNSQSEAIVSATIALSHSLNLKTVGEGVETERQRDFLASAGCDEAQGFLYGKAMPAEEFTNLLKGQSR